VIYGEVPEEGDMIEFLEGPMPTAEFLQAIHLATEWNVLATEEARAINLEFIISKKTPKEALEILKFYDLVYDWEEDTKFLKVYTKTEWQEERFGDPEAVEFAVKNADVQYMESLLTSLLSSTGRVVTDQRTGRIYVWDTPDNLAQMTKTFEDVDVPLEKREFLVQHADLPDVEAVVGGLLSPNGSLLTDARTGQLIVWDGPAVLEQVGEALDKLDVPVESQTFQIVHVNAEDLVENLEVLLSERGLIQVDPRFNALVITDLPTRLAKMAGVIETLDRELETKTWTIQYADPDFIADQIELYIPSEMGEVIVNFDVHQVTVSGLPERIAQVDTRIQEWDIPREQVLIEAYIVEVGTEVQREFNVNWSYFDNLSGSPIMFKQGDGSNGIADREENPVTFGQLPYGIPLYGGLQVNDEGVIERPVVTNLDGETVIDRLAGDNLAATLDYLDQKDKVRILNSPRVVVQDGEEALFQNATQVPFVSGSSNFGGQGGINNNYSTSNRVEFIDVGTILSVLPRVSEDKNIVLDVTAEDSTFTEKIIISNDLQSTVPEKTTRGAETQLRVTSGDTVVMGGLRRDRASDSVSKVPLLGDLPLVGKVFRSPKKQSQQSDLMIFLTATIVPATTHPETAKLEEAERIIYEQLRTESKDTWGRWSDKLSKGEHEIVVAIGQGGNIHSEGEPFTVEQIKALFTTLGPSSMKTIVLRVHPRAPLDVVNAVRDAALVSGLKLEDDASSTPLVPDLGE
jgi:general secretion pathway protein D